MDHNDPLLADDGVLDLYLGTFAGRTDLYVENAAGVIRKPLTADVVRHAVEHRYALSAYTGRNMETHVGAIDFDTDEGLAQALASKQAMHENDVPASVFGSRRGAHLWVTVVDGWVTVGTMIRAMRSALRLAGIDEVPQIEVFPKRKPNNLAQGALRLPGLTHQRTGHTYPMWVQSDLAVDASLEQILERHELSTKHAILDLSTKVSHRVPYPHLSGEAAFYAYRPARDFGPAPSASQILQAWGAERARPGGTVKCPKHEDRHASLTIFKDDERVFCGAPHCALHGNGRGVGSVMLSRM